MTGHPVNHRERLLDIANEAIDKLQRKGFTTVLICSTTGLSESAFDSWRKRKTEPRLDALELLLNLAGFSLQLSTRLKPLPESLQRKIAIERQNAPATSFLFCAAASTLGEFSASTLAEEAHSTIQAARRWIHRHRRWLAEVGTEPTGHGPRIIWRWVGKEQAQALPANAPRAQYARAAAQLGEFTCEQLAAVVGRSKQAVAHWTIRYRYLLVEARREGSKGAIVWRWVKPDEPHGLGYMQGRGAS